MKRTDHQTLSIESRFIVDTFEEVKFLKTSEVLEASDVWDRTLGDRGETDRLKHRGCNQLILPSAENPFDLDRCGDYCDDADKDTASICVFIDPGK